MKQLNHNRRCLLCGIKTYYMDYKICITCKIKSMKKENGSTKKE